MNRSTPYLMIKKYLLFGIKDRMTYYILRLLSVSSTKFSSILMAAKVTVNWSSLVGLLTHMSFKIITMWGAKALMKGKAMLRSLHWKTDSSVCKAFSWTLRETDEDLVQKTVDLMDLETSTITSHLTNSTCSWFLYPNPYGTEYSLN